MAARTAGYSVLRDGLNFTQADTPAKAGYVEALATWSSLGGAAGRLEAGLHILPPLSIFAYGQVDETGPSVGAGAKWSF